MSYRSPERSGANLFAEMPNSSKLFSSLKHHSKPDSASHNRSCAVSWGIESEFVLAFHRDRLTKVLSFFDDTHRPIVVSDDDVDHQRILTEAARALGAIQAYDLRKRWPSPLLAARDTETPIQALNPEGPTSGFYLPWYRYPVEDEKTKSKYDGRRYHRTFALEPMLLAQDILHQSGISVKPIGIAYPAKTTGYGLMVNEGRHGDDQRVLYPGLVKPEVVVQKGLLDYDAWILTRDISVTAAEKSELRSKFMLSNAEKDFWESDGVELISPKFDRHKIDKAFQELTRILSALSYQKFVPQNNYIDNGGRIFENQHSENKKVTEADHGKFVGGYGALESIFAGTHVHIGLDLNKRPEHSLLILKHIAFIVLANEELISSLHPYHRRGLAKDHVSPLSEVFPPSKRARTASGERRYQIAAEETRMSELREKYITTTNLASNRQWFMKKFFRERSPAPENIMPLHDEQYDQLVEQLLDVQTSAKSFFLRIQQHWSDDKGTYMDHGSIVDFSRVARNMRIKTDHKFTPPCTIEFRQHACTLDADEVKHWVKFLFALVDLAERRALQATNFQGIPLSSFTAQKDKYAGPITSVAELCGPSNLNLPPDEVQYWISRAQGYADDKDNFDLKTAERRRKRAIAKARHHVQLDANEREFIPRRSYRKASRDSMLKYVQENLNLEEGYAPDQPRIDLLRKRTRSELVELAMKMDVNLVKTGCYAPLPDLGPDGLPLVYSPPPSTSS